MKSTALTFKVQFHPLFSFDASESCCPASQSPPPPLISWSFSSEFCCVDLKARRGLVRVLPTRRRSANGSLSPLFSLFRFWTLISEVSGQGALYLVCGLFFCLAVPLSLLETLGPFLTLVFFANRSRFPPYVLVATLPTWCALPFFLFTYCLHWRSFPPEYLIRAFFASFLTVACPP